MPFKFTDVGSTYSIKLNPGVLAKHNLVCGLLWPLLILWKKSILGNAIEMRGCIFISLLKKKKFCISMLSFCVPSNLRSENAGSKMLHIWNSFGLLYQGAEKICFSFCAQNAQVKPVPFPAHKQSTVQGIKKDVYRDKPSLHSHSLFLCLAKDHLCIHRSPSAPCR